MMPKRKEIRLGTRTIDEASLLGELKRVQSEIEKWAIKNELWHDSGFATPYDYHNEAPRSHDTLLLITEGPLGRIFSIDGAYSDYETSFTSLLDELGFSFEIENHYTFSLYPTNDELREDFLSLYRWQWLQRLAKKNVLSLHSEVFEHFAKRPDDMQRLGWRQFEELLDAIFKNQGFYTELGPGSNDGGVDLRLYQSRAIPEIVTLVQAKRYKRAIDLQAVAALFGIAVKQQAHKAIFATTSYFLPGVVDWAKSDEHQIHWPNLELADRSKIASWCAAVGKNLTDYFANGLAGPPRILEKTGPLTGTIVVARDGYNATNNYFARIEADFPSEAILCPIGNQTVSGDGTAGSEMPSESAQVSWTREARLLAFKDDLGGFQAARMYFVAWDGTPQFFNSD